MSYRFALQPRWLLSHLFVLGLVVVMINLGFWQLQRHDARAERNALVEERADAEPVPLGAALEAADEPSDLQFVRVMATGTYDDEFSVLVANRSLDGAPGFWVMTPLVREAGAALWVVRGFVGRGTVAEQGADVLQAPRGSIVVTGLLQDAPGGGVFAGGPDGDLPEVNRPDTALLSGPEWAGGDDLGVYLQAESDPSPRFTAVPPPPLDSGPHRSYAAQWFIFALIAVIGYPLILRKAAGDKARDKAHESSREAAGTLTADDALV